MTHVYDNILGLIGHTPLVKLNRVTNDISATVYAKLESCNPGHSTKDRIALHIIEAAEKKGLLKPGSTIVETTSGNTGFSIAMVSIIKGYQCILAVSDKTKAEKIAYLKALGATVYICPANVAPDDPRSYYEVAKKIAAETPDSIYINQYFNELNIDAHYQSTGPEIWEQTEGKITHLIACTGTGGTLSGSAKFLKEKNPDTDYYFIICADMVDYLPKWHKIDELATMVQFVGVQRPRYKAGTSYPVIWVDVPLMDISSSMVRDFIKQGRVPNFMVPHEVLDYIEEKGLYQ